MNRERTIVRTAQGFLHEHGWEVAQDLYGIGAFGNASWRLFCHGDWQSIVIDPKCDRTVKTYGRWLERAVRATRMTPAQLTEAVKEKDFDVEAAVSEHQRKQVEAGQAAAGRATGGSPVAAGGRKGSKGRKRAGMSSGTARVKKRSKGPPVKSTRSSPRFMPSSSSSSSSAASSSASASSSSFESNELGRKRPRSDESGKAKGDTPRKQPSRSESTPRQGGKRRRVAS